MPWRWVQRCVRNVCIFYILDYNTAQTLLRFCKLNKYLFWNNLSLWNNNLSYINIYGVKNINYSINTCNVIIKIHLLLTLKNMLCTSKLLFLNCVIYFCCCCGPLCCDVWSNPYDPSSILTIFWHTCGFEFCNDTVGCSKSWDSHYSLFAVVI